MNAMRMEDTCDALGAIMKRMLLYDHHGDILFFRDCANTSNAPKAQRTTTSVPFHVPQPPAADQLLQPPAAGPLLQHCYVELQQRLVWRRGVMSFNTSSLQSFSVSILSWI